MDSVLEHSASAEVSLDVGGKDVSEILFIPGGIVDHNTVGLLCSTEQYLIYTLNN